MHIYICSSPSCDRLKNYAKTKDLVYKLSTHVDLNVNYILPFSSNHTYPMTKEMYNGYILWNISWSGTRRTKKKTTHSFYQNDAVTIDKTAAIKWKRRKRAQTFCFPSFLLYSKTAVKDGPWVVRTLRCIFSLDYTSSSGHHSCTARTNSPVVQRYVSWTLAIYVYYLLFFSLTLVCLAVLPSPKRKTDLL